jgi:hypothetical protein
MCALSTIFFRVGELPLSLFISWLISLSRIRGFSIDGADVTLSRHQGFYSSSVKFKVFEPVMSSSKPLSVIQAIFRYKQIRPALTLVLFALTAHCSVHGNNNKTTQNLSVTIIECFNKVGSNQTNKKFNDACLAVRNCLAHSINPTGTSVSLIFHLPRCFFGFQNESNPKGEGRRYFC